MKKTLAVLAGTLLSCAIGANSYADPTIGIVNIQQVLDSDNGMKKIETSLNDQFSKERDKLADEGQKINQETTQFEKNKSVMKKEIMTKKEKGLQEKVKKFQEEQMRFQQKYMQAQRDAIQSLVTKIRSAANTVATENSLQTVFSDTAILYAKDSKDITADVLKALGKPSN